MGLIKRCKLVGVNLLVTVGERISLNKKGHFGVRYEAE